MERNATPDVKAKLEETTTSIVALLKVTLSDGTVHRLNNSRKDFTSNGDVYISFPFTHSPIQRELLGRSSQTTFTVGFYKDGDISEIAQAELRGCPIVATIVERDYPDNPIEQLRGEIDSVNWRFSKDKNIMSLSVFQKEDKLGEKVPYRKHSEYCPAVYKGATFTEPTGPCNFTEFGVLPGWPVSTEVEKYYRIEHNGKRFMALNNGITGPSLPAEFDTALTNGTEVQDLQVIWFYFDISMCGLTKKDCDARLYGRLTGTKFKGFLGWNWAN